ncbi:hypothetical protein AYI68_g7881 [Smittium mucronatum]|uniref:Uncharacterized protein n=1 Tax=Smittium mucronatum TaxID=133383 RepID=A0A1R0GMG9_9FUNG|nr:hypothetical protein AYI68_g7881 [Smittium mucronatum]
MYLDTVQINVNPAGVRIDTSICSIPTSGINVCLIESPTIAITTKLPVIFVVNPAKTTQYPAPLTIADSSNTSDIPTQ